MTKQDSEELVKISESVVDAEKQGEDASKTASQTGDVWLADKFYKAGSRVVAQNVVYAAKSDNQGSNPTVSSQYWGRE
jgi:hypothetical protein